MGHRSHALCPMPAEKVPGEQALYIEALYIYKYISIYSLAGAALAQVNLTALFGDQLW